MANATVAGLASFLARVMIETTTDTIHVRRLRRKRPNNCRKAVRTTAMGRHPEGKVRTLIRRSDSCWEYIAFGLDALCELVAM